MGWLNSITEPMDVNLANYRRWRGAGTWRAARHGIPEAAVIVTEQFTLERIGRCIQLPLFWIICFCKKVMNIRKNART